MNVGRFSRLVCLGLLWGLVFCGCAVAGAPSLDEAERFDAFRLYYAGEKANDLPLEDILTEEWQKDQHKRSWTFVYGTCDPPEGEGGCSVPLQIQNFSICERWSVLITRGYKLYDFRGAKARGGYKGRGRPEIAPMEVFTGRTTIVIWGYETSLVKDAARKLRRVGEARPRLRLPPPAPGSLQGKLPCQRKSG